MKSNINLFLKGAITSYLNTGMSIILNILIVPVMLKGLGQFSYGLWVTISSIFGFMPLTDLGIGQAITKIIAENSNKDRDTYIKTRIYTTTMITNFLFGLITLLANIILSFFIYKFINIHISKKYYISSIYLLLSLNFFFCFIGSVYKNILAGYKYNYVNNIVNVSKLILNFIAVYLILTCSNEILNICVAQIIISIIYYLIYRHQIIKYRINLKFKFEYFVFDELKIILKPGIYYFIITISFLLITSTDNFILSYFISQEVVAMYSSAYKIATTFMLLIFLIIDNLFPFISELNGSNDKTKIRNLFFLSINISLILGVFFGLMIILFGEKMISIWIGSSNFIGNTTILFMGIYVIMQSFTHVPIVFIQSMGKHKGVAGFVMIEAVLNLILSSILVQRIGAAGAIMGTFITDLLVLFWYSNFYICRLLNISLKKFINKIIIRNIEVVVLWSAYMLIIKVLTNNFLIQFIMYIIFFLCIFRLWLKKVKSLCIGNLEEVLHVSK